MTVSSFLRLLGAAAVLGALIALALPLSLHAVDRTGERIPCGNGFQASHDVARQQDELNRSHHDRGGPGFAVSDYGAQCAALVADRRLTAITVAGGGVAISTVVCLGALRPLRVNRRHAHPANYSDTTSPIRHPVNAAQP
jgi:hypothetical protein